MTYFRTRGGRPGPYRRTVNGLLPHSVSGAEAMAAQLAGDLADLTDAAKREQDPRLFLASTGRLVSVLARLGVVLDPAGVSRGDDSDGGGLPPGLAEVLGTGADLRNAEES